MALPAVALQLMARGLQAAGIELSLDVIMNILTKHYDAESPTGSGKLLGSGDIPTELSEMLPKFDQHQSNIEEAGEALGHIIGTNYSEMRDTPNKADLRIMEEQYLEGLLGPDYRLRKTEEKLVDDPDLLGSKTIDNVKMEWDPATDTWYEADKPPTVDVSKYMLPLTGDLDDLEEPPGSVEMGFSGPVKFYEDYGESMWKAALENAEETKTSRDILNDIMNLYRDAGPGKSKKINPTIWKDIMNRGWGE